MSCSQRSLELEADIGGTATEKTTQWVLVEYTRAWLQNAYTRTRYTQTVCFSTGGVSKRDGWKVLYIRKQGCTGQNVYWWNLNTGTCKVARISSDWTNGFELNDAWAHPQDIGLGSPQVLVCTHGTSRSMLRCVGWSDLCSFENASQTHFTGCSLAGQSLGWTSICSNRALLTTWSGVGSDSSGGLSECCECCLNEQPQYIANEYYSR